MCQKKKQGEKDSAVLKSASMHRYDDYIKKSKERLDTEIGNNINNTKINRTTKIENNNVKKNKCMNIPSDKIEIRR